MGPLQKPLTKLAAVCDANKTTADKFVESSMYDTTYLVEVKGIPWTATKWHIVEFFEDLNILNGRDGIHFKVDNTLNNDAFIQLTTYTDYQMALKQKVRRVGSAAIKGELQNQFFSIKMIIQYLQIGTHPKEVSELNLLFFSMTDCI